MSYRSDLVLGYLATSPNASFSPAQLQKFLFLIDRELADELHGPLFDFRPYHYGPYDSEVYAVMDELSSRGEIEIEGYGKSRRFHVSKKGSEKSKYAQMQIPQHILERIESLSVWVRSLTFDELITAIYDMYPDTAVNSIYRRG